jgi:hypothetical protein
MNMISQEAAKNVLEGLRTVQYAIYNYEEFIKVLKRRLKRFTGKNEVMFYNERQIVLELGRLGALQEWNGLKGRAGSN